MMPPVVRPARPIPAAKQKRIKDMLKAHGHPVGKVNALSMVDNKRARAALVGLHGVSVEQLRAAGCYGLEDE